MQRNAKSTPNSTNGSAKSSSGTGTSGLGSQPTFPMVSFVVLVPTRSSPLVPLPASHFMKDTSVLDDKVGGRMVNSSLSDDDMTKAEKLNPGEKERGRG